MVFIGKCESDSESSDEELAKTYKLLHIKWEEACMIREKHNKTISTLLQ